MDRPSPIALAFYGRRELGGRAPFVEAARLVGEAAARSGLSVQVRGPRKAAPAGAAQSATVRLDREAIRDIAWPRRYELEVVIERNLVRIPPMGDFLAEGGILLVNFPGLPPGAPEGRTLWLDADAVAARRGVPAAIPLAGASWRALARLKPSWPLPYSALARAAGESPGGGSLEAALREGYELAGGLSLPDAV